MIRVWKIHRFFFTQDKDENGYFFYMNKKGDIKEIDYCPVIEFSEMGAYKTKIKLEGVIFMEEGEVVYE